MRRQPFADNGPPHTVDPALHNVSGTLWYDGDTILRTRGHGRVRPEVRFERIHILGATQAVGPFPEREEMITAVGEEARQVHLTARRRAPAPGVGQSRRDLQDAVPILGPAPLKLLLQHGLQLRPGQRHGHQAIAEWLHRKGFPIRHVTVAFTPAWRVGEIRAEDLNAIRLRR